MRKLSLVAIMSLSLLMAGCKADAEAVLADTIAKMNEITALLKTVTDQNSSKAAAPKLKALVDDLQNIKQRDDKLRLSEAEKKRILEKYKTQTDDMMTALKSESMRIQANPTLQTLELQDALKSMARLK
jgi:hypothetical protein